MKKIKNALFLLLAIVMVLSMTPAALAAGSGTAYASTQNVEVNGTAVQFQMYALKDAKGNDTNYVKLRDVAYVLSGTAASFNVDYNSALKTILVVTGQDYISNGTEMATPFSGNRTYQHSSNSVLMGGKVLDLDAIVLTDDQGGGYTYFKLRDLGTALGFEVGWTAERGVYVETGPACDLTAEEFPAEVVRLINLEREQEGLAPLETYSALTAAAQLRSAEVVTSVSTTRPDGTSYTTALAETGAGKNVRDSREMVMSGPYTPSSFVKMCMSSYKSVILNPELTHIGAGYTRDLSNPRHHFWSVICTREGDALSNPEPPAQPQPQPQPQPQATPLYGESGLLYSTDEGVTLTLWEHYVIARTATSYSFTATGVNTTREWRMAHGSKFTVSWSVDDPSLLSLEETLWDEGVPRQVKIIGEKSGNAKITCKVTGEDGYVTEAYCYIEVRPSSASTQMPSTPTNPSSDMTAEDLCVQVVELVNQERAKQGLSPLSTMTNLTAAANTRAPELVTKFSHDRPDGSSCFTALKEAKVTYFTAGENIAAGQSTPEEVMNDWMNSPGHRANILNSEFTHIGVGYYNGCWVQMFIGK